jgi:cytochrome c
MKTIRTISLAVAVAAAGLLAVPGAALAASEDAAKELARKNNCFKCHAIQKEKDGPAWAKVAEKMRDKPDAQSRLVTHITSGEMSKFPDGHEEKHKIVETDPPKDMAQINNLIEWILSLK